MQNTLKILITGAGGMLGTDLAKALGPAFDVVGLDRKPAAHLSVPLDICDLTQTRKTQDCVVGHKPDLVFHSAALTDVDYCEEHQDEALANNVEATKNIVSACNELDIPLVFYSTDYIFDGKKKGAYVETDAPAPLSFYGKTKLLGEEAVLQNAKKAVIFRISWLFGVYGRCFPKSILRQAAEVKKLSVVSDQVGSPTYSRDIASAMARLMQTKKDILFAPGTRVYHLTNSGTTSWADLARFILKRSDLLKVRVEDITSDHLKRPASRPANSELSNGKTKTELGIELRSWQDAVKEFLAEWQEVRDAAEAKARENVAADEASG